MDSFEREFNQGLGVGQPYRDRVRNKYDPYGMWAALTGPDDEKDENNDSGAEGERIGGYSSWEGGPPSQTESAVTMDPEVARGLGQEVAESESERNAWRRAYLGAYNSEYSSTDTLGASDRDSCEESGQGAVVSAQDGSGAGGSWAYEDTDTASVASLNAAGFWTDR